MTKNWPVKEIPVDLCIAYEGNPNEMRDDMFSALVAEIAESGWLVPIQVAGPEEDGTYRVIGGHHRLKAAQVLGMEEVPAVIVDPVEFDRDKQEIQVVKQNVLHGELNPEKFTALFNRLTEKYDADLLKDMMAFTQRDSFNKVYLDAKRGLPPEMQEELEKVRDEIKTVDDLSLVLNSLFSKYGNTLESNFMVFTFGGKESILVRLTAPGSYQRIKKFAEWCYANGVKMDEQIMARMEFPNFNDVPANAGEVAPDTIGRSIVMQ